MPAAGGQRARPGALCGFDSTLMVTAAGAEKMADRLAQNLFQLFFGLQRLPCSALSPKSDR